MKRFLLFLFLLSGLMANSQPYPFNNEWIDYNKTYYKFKVGFTGIYRIPQSMLTTLGIGTADAQHFQLWRNGQEVPLYTSVQTGTLGASDYIEFFGEQNDGKPDNVMYRIPDYQLNDRWSLQTDTAAFFLTVNPAGNNKRMLPTVNDVAGNTLPAEPYFMYKAQRYWKDRIGSGYAQVVGESVFSSAYDRGEGWTSIDVTKGGTLTQTFPNLYVYTGPGAPTDATFRIHASGYNGINPRVFRVKLNGDSIMGQTMDFFDYVKVEKQVPVSMITSNTATLEVTNQCQAPGSDRMLVAYMSLTYPRQFNFGNTTNYFEFSMPASNGNYLEIANFNIGGSGLPPLLYDLTNGQRYVANMSTPGISKYVLQPSATERRLIIIAQDPLLIQTVPSFQTRNFVNYGLAANQGDYLIITAPKFLTGSGGSQPVEAYKNYRSSAAGGGYNVKVYMIDELIDQFGFGIKMHPLSVRNFVRWARATYTNPLKNIFLIGKGVQYIQFRVNEANPELQKLAFIPTFGQPASDNLMAAEPGLNQIPLTPMGRLSVVTADEITPYLDKVIQYEQVRVQTSHLISEQAWKKNVAHVVGASDSGLSTALKISLDKFKRIIADTFYGANVHTFAKTSAETVQIADNERLQNLFQEGLGMITYFGHSSATTLEYNLDNPQNYNNPGKYPFFILLGCNAGNLFNFNLTRLQTKETISEKYVLAQQRGSIASLASTHLGIVHYLDMYGDKAYNAMTNTKYGATLGEIIREAIIQVFNQQSQNDYYARFHCEQTTLHGDPAIRMNTFAKPDYVIEEPLVRINPAFISIAETSFRVDAKFMNIGKAINRPLIVEVKRTFPNNTTEIVRRDTLISGVDFADSLRYNVMIVGTRDKGLNKITITLDPDHLIDELYENNNSVTKEIFIFEDEARPVYPYNYSIVNTQGIKFQASTANPFSPMRQYFMEIDTTELFNSPLRVSRNVNTIGGIMEFDPGVTFTDSTVYYWRVAPAPTTGSPIWNTASFIYLPSSEPGFNQSHYYQHLKSELDGITINPANRIWQYDSLPHFIFSKNAVFGTGSSQEGDFIVSPDGDPFIRSACVGNSLIFNTFDPLKFKATLNETGLYGSVPPCAPSRRWNFEYSYMDSANRRKAMNFMDSIPDGHFVVVRNILNNTQTTGFISDWQSDAAVYGPNNTLYHKLKAVGMNDIDSFTSPRAFIYIYQKGNPGFSASALSGLYDIITLSKSMKTPDTLAYITSPMFGKAKQWKTMKWRGTIAPDVTPGDLPVVEVVGVRNDGTESIVYPGVNMSQQDIDISGIDAVEFPYVKLKMKNLDSANFTPYQLRYWRLTYVPVPEGAIAPNLHFVTRDNVELGEPFDFSIGFKNVSPLPFDSMKVNMVVTDRNNVEHMIPVPRRRPMAAYPDSLIVGARIETSDIPGSNTLLVEFNPDNDQLEQHHFNNFAYRNFYVKPDSLNPLLDVTFDGVHILNRDIVSSKPDIMVKLKDEARWMMLDDTSLLKLQVRYPDGNLRRFYFNNDTMQFVPAGQAPNNSNVATINFKPHFLADGDYELLVSGRDRSDNTAGNIEYRVAFQVFNKPMISNMLNYPNPFTTSTAFVFTITGSEIPQNIRIQIMTITGKIVRDITKDELGPLRIGRNITEYKWDGTDQYGQKLANGIYLYRVITNLNGKSLDKFKADGDNTDKYFNKGYGKMYLMR